MTANLNFPSSEAFVKVGNAITNGCASPEYVATMDPMVCWRNVLKLIRDEPDDEKAARLIQAVSESLTSELQVRPTSQETRQKRPSPNPLLHIGLILFILIWGVLILSISFVVL